MKVGVVGLGTMGVGIAQLAVEAGLETVGREVTDELGETGRGRIEHFLSRKVEKGQIDSFEIDLLTLTTEVADLADCDVVIEAVVEELDAKRFLAVIRMSIEPRVQLPDDTVAEIVSSGLLGDKYMSLTPGGSEKNIAPGGQIKYTQSSVSLEHMIGQMIFSAPANKKPEGDAAQPPAK